jgi:predicted nucleotidyltransferase
VVADLLFASSGIEPEVVAAAEPLEIFPGVTAPVAQIGHLIALKLLARDDRTRPQDAVDLRALCDVAPETETARTRSARRPLAVDGSVRTVPL